MMSLTAILLLACALTCGPMTNGASAGLSDTKGTAAIGTRSGNGSASVELTTQTQRERINIGQQLVPKWVTECTWRQWTALQKEQYFTTWTGAAPPPNTNPNETWNAVFCPTTGHTRPFNSLADGTGIYAT